MYKEGTDRTALGPTHTATVCWTGDLTKLGHLLCVWKRHSNCRVLQVAVHSILYSSVLTCAKYAGENESNNFKIQIRLLLLQRQTKTLQIHSLASCIQLAARQKKHSSDRNTLLVSKCNFCNCGWEDWMGSLLECHGTNIETIECYLVTRYKEYSLKVCKLTVTPALIRINGLTVFTLYRNSLNCGDLSLPVHSYQLLNKNTK